MEIDLFIIFFLLFIAFFMTIRAASYKSKYEVLETERNEDGWRNEAMFWRHHFDKESAEYSENI